MLVEKFLLDTLRCDIKYGSNILRIVFKNKPVIFKVVLVPELLDNQTKV